MKRPSEGPFVFVTVWPDSTSCEDVKYARDRQAERTKIHALRFQQLYQELDGQRIFVGPQTIRGRCSDLHTDILV